jgi:tRNA modification GTPase
MSEAAIDFADEDLPPETWQLMRDPLARVSRRASARGLGPPRRRTGPRRLRGRDHRAGEFRKIESSQRLAGREAAITSEREGTTRDVIEVRMEIGGLAVTLIDTAGLRDTEDEVERIGIERGRKRAAEADLRVFLKAHPDDAAEDAQPDDIVRSGGPICGHARHFC